MEEIQLIWGWQPALYLFLGGLGGGTAVVAGLIYLREGNARQRTVCASFWFAVACLVVGLLLLLTELITPLRGMMMWQSFSDFSSWMTYGAWIVFSAVVVMGFFALGATPAVQKLLAKKDGHEGTTEDNSEGPAGKRAAASVSAPDSASAVAPAPAPMKGLAVASIALGLCVAIYTGILLMSAPGVPLWNTPLLPCLFTASALDTGVAAVEIIAIARAREEGEPKGLLHTLDKAVLALVVLEAVAVTALLGLALAGAGDAGAQSFQLVAAQSAALLTSGALWPGFWILFVPFALVIPFVTALMGLREKNGKNAALVGAASVLVGGCTLRFLVLMAGLHVDYVADALMALL